MVAFINSFLPIVPSGAEPADCEPLGLGLPDGLVLSDGVGFAEPLVPGATTWPAGLRPAIAVAPPASTTSAANTATAATRFRCRRRTVWRTASGPSGTTASMLPARRLSKASRSERSPRVSSRSGIARLLPAAPVAAGRGGLLAVQLRFVPLGPVRRRFPGCRLVVFRLAVVRVVVFR